MRRPSGAASRLGGFTLLELLVVLVLAAIAAATVGINAQSFMGRAKYHEAVRGVASQLNQARSLCTQQGRTVVVSYVPAARQLLVDGQVRLEIPESVEVSWQPAAPGQAEAPASPGHAIFVFNADGGARGGSFAVAQGGRGVAFHVNWLSGMVEQQAGVSAP